jgi:hypothetical protein
MKLALRRRRLAALRRRAVTLSLILFALTWAAVFGQMALGHDPVLGSRGKAKASKSSSTDVGASTSEATSSEVTNSAQTYYQAPTPAPVVTSVS